MVRGKESNNSQKTPIANLWKDGESYRNISSNMTIPFTSISSFIVRFKRRNTVENSKEKKEQVLQGKFLLEYQEN